MRTDQGKDNGKAGADKTKSHAGHHARDKRDQHNHGDQWNTGPDELVAHAGNER